jgi:hypothetical protein
MKDNPISFLANYGLDKLLTEQDDPCLWADAVKKHWPKPEALLTLVPRLLFGLGRIPDEKEELCSQSGMESLGEWRFEPNDSDSLKPVLIQGEDIGRLFPEFILEISRPSAGQTTPIVHAGDNPAPLIGYGETHAWERQPDGSLNETTEWISSWRS